MCGTVAVKGSNQKLFSCYSKRLLKDNSILLRSKEMTDCEDLLEAELNKQPFTNGTCGNEADTLNNFAVNEDYRPNTSERTEQTGKYLRMMCTSKRQNRWKISTFGAILSNVVTAVICLNLTKSSCGSCPATISPPCPSGWVEHEGKCYYFSESEGTWNSSQSNCSAFGASLVMIEDQKEMDFINQTKGPTEYWIGLTRKDGQPWEWADGSIFNNWFEIRTNGFCAYLDDDRVGSTLCGTKRNWICSKSAHIS
ncbi:C-type lectin domain family 2 member B-like isoform X1 [Anolis sagrei]|uniref:C-type lectin domain family 2 member B-like isoform X1 n=1 Tax=Anolis sagrei TaxID=38937 RepID=UPI003522940D